MSYRTQECTECYKIELIETRNKLKKKIRKKDL